MKFLSLLIAVMVLALNCMPCSDAGLRAHEGQRSVTTAGTTTHDSPGDEHQDLCSPFCQCSCCSLAYALPLSLPSEAVLKTSWYDKQFSLLVQHCPPGITLPVWQPPQLA